MKIVTLLFLRKEYQILLAMKKRGVGVGKWNGVGGKVDSGETVEAAALRECEEEICVRPKHVTKVAELEFIIPSQEFHNYTHVYIAETWEGEPQETEEMAPRWFALDEIPYDSMWSDDAIWLPRVLIGETVKATFHFDQNERVSNYTITPLN